MSSREDLENGYDSQGGSRQLSFSEDVIAPSDVVGEWYNPILECQFRILENGIIQRHQSKIAQSQKQQKSPWISWTDKDVLKKGDNAHGEGEFKDHAHMRYLLAQEMVSANVIKSEKKNRLEELKQDLQPLSLLELIDAHAKLRDKPTTGRSSYIWTIQNELISRKATRDGKYNNVGKTDDDPISYSEHDLNVANPDTGTFWKGRVLELAPTRISESRGMRMVGSDLIKKTWFYEDANGNWKLFDGFNITENGDVVPDSFKSDLLVEQGLLPRYKVLSDKVNAMTLATSPNVQAGTLSVDEFNSDFAGTPHIPATDTDRIIEWFTDNTQDFKDTEGGFLAVQTLEDEGKLALFNDLDNLDLDNITELATFITNNHGVPAGHPAFATTLKSLRTVMEGRNERGDSEQDGDSFTGYQRPVYRNGTHVPYNAMTQEERSDYRSHWDNLYDRPLGWLHHTPEGRELWQGTVDEYTAFSKEQEIKDTEFVEAEFAALGIPIKDNKFTDGVLKGMTVEAACDELLKEGAALDDLELPSQEEENVAAPLTTGLESHQQEWLYELKTSKDAGYNPEQVFGSGIWSHLERGNYQGKGNSAPPGLTQRRELLFGSTGQDWYRRLGERQAEQHLIGMPLASSSEDGTSAYDIYRQAEEGGRDIAIVNGVEYPIDELHKRRVGGAIQVTDVDDEGNFVLGRVNSKGAVTPIDAPTSITTGNKDFVASLTDYLGYTMINKLVRDGVLSEEYATGAPFKQGKNLEELQAELRVLNDARKNAAADLDAPLEETLPDGKVVRYGLGALEMVDGKPVEATYTPDERAARGRIDATRSQQRAKSREVEEAYGVKNEEVQDAWDAAESQDVGNRVKRRDGVGVPVPPKIGTEENDALIIALNNILRDYKSMRGTDNEEGLYRFEEIPSDTYAAFTRGSYDKKSQKKKSSHILNILYKYLNESGHLKDENGQTIGNLEYKKEELLDRIEAATDRKAELNNIIEETDEVLAGSDGGDFEPPTGRILGTAGEEEDPKDEASQNAGTLFEVLNDYIKELTADAAAQGKLEDEGFLSEIADLTGQQDKAREQMLFSIENNANNFLNNNPQFAAYKEQIQQRHYSEVLQNAPLNIRATAFRNRIDGLNTRLDQAQTQGDLHDIARDWARTGLVEYNDILNVDRDGASKLQRLRRKLENTNGVDWTAIDKEYTDYLNSKNDADNMILGVQENIDAMEASGLTTQRGEKESDFTPAEWAKKEEADARLKGLKKYLRGLQAQPRYSYGSQEHVADLKGHPSSQGIYQTLDNTGIEDIDTTLYEGMKTAPNPVADVFRTGLNAYKENRLLGNSPITGLLQALTASIGEGTGIGGDRIRGLDVRKPIDEHKADYGGSWFDWLRPLPVFGGGTVKDARTQEAGRRGEVYTPDPTIGTEIYVGNEPTGVTYEQAIDATQANIRTEMPPIPPDVDATPSPPPPQPTTEDET